jgi:hypothetical protein
MDSKGEVGMKTASEMKGIMDEAGTFTKEMFGKVAKDMGESHARCMEKWTAEAMQHRGSYSVKQPLQFPTGEGGCTSDPPHQHHHSSTVKEPPDNFKSGHVYETPTGPLTSGPGYLGGPKDHVHTIPNSSSVHNGKVYNIPEMPVYNVPEMPQTWTEGEIRNVVRTIVNEAVAHLVSELDGMTQRCQELEIELEIAQNSFSITEGDVNPKRRGIF